MYKNIKYLFRTRVKKFLLLYQFIIVEQCNKGKTRYKKSQRQCGQNRYSNVHFFSDFHRFHKFCVRNQCDDYHQLKFVSRRENSCCDASMYMICSDKALGSVSRGQLTRLSGGIFETYTNIKKVIKITLQQLSITVQPNGQRMVEWIEYATIYQILSS